ncbi:MAG: cobyric acid synthase CobQ [Candidatus Hydrothermarchaeota archaeon]
MRAIMVQGTGSSAGKTVFVAGVCRSLARRGFKVTPFKSQNMSLNSFVTKEGDEIAVAQALQAFACGIDPKKEMNPILLKPKEDAVSQVIVLGKPVGNMNFNEYRGNFYEKALEVIENSLNSLKNEYEVVVIEGAGNPAEINIMDRDLANMKIAEIADANVILIADIDKGGVFASIYGTYKLLPEKWRRRIKGIVINKFRGDKEILEPGLKEIEKRTGIPVIGIIPYHPTLSMPEEDSASLSERKWRSSGPIDCAVIWLPRISNFTDIEPLDYEPSLSIRFVKLNEDLGEPDIIIIPGTRNTTEDLLKLKNSDVFKDILKFKGILIGICGGYQILGKKIEDENQLESKYGSVNGLGFLNAVTVFEKGEKITQRLKGYVFSEEIFLKKIVGKELKGFEIHEGTTYTEEEPFLRVKEGIGNNGDGFDGSVNGNVIGTYMHGLFENDSFRSALVKHLCDIKGVDYIPSRKRGLDKRLNELSDIIEKEVDFQRILELVYEV